MEEGTVVLFQFEQSLSVGISEIDGQHKQLINLINQLHEAMSSGKGKDVFGKTLDELVKYTVYHFGTEERYMQRFGYENYATH